MSKIAIITGSTRPGRVNIDVANWVLERAQERNDAQYELVDIADFNFPVLDEAMPAGYGQYANEHTKAWAAKIAEFDGFIFVTGEYNHSVPAALTNALSTSPQSGTTRLQASSPTAPQWAFAQLSTSAASFPSFRSHTFKRPAC